MFIVADVGGTKTRIAGSTDLESFSEPLIFETPKNYGDGVKKIVESAARIASGERVEKVCMGIPGVISDDYGSIVTAPNLKEWMHQRVANDLEKALGAKVHLENDTALCGLGEATKGAGVGARTLIYITVSTGVGGVRIVDGHINSPLHSAEIGYQYINIGDHLQRFSSLISGRAIEERFGKKPYEIPKDDPVWEELARYVAIGVHNSILFWTPDRVVLGGSMFNEIGISIERVQFHLKEIMKAFPTIPEIAHSKLGDLGGLWGGLARLKQLR